MAKRSKRHHVRQNKDHAGCMWGIMSMFDFRHGRTTRRLLSDRRYMNRNISGVAHPTSEVNTGTNSKESNSNEKSQDGEKSEKPAFDLIKTRVKELIEEEMHIEQGPKKQNDANKRTGKTSKRSFDQEKTSPYHDLEALMKETLFVHQKRNEQQGDLDAGAKRSFPTSEDKLIAAVEMLMSEKSKSTNGDHEKDHHSKDVFQMLSSNKETFLKLLHDQSQHSFPPNEDQKSKSTESPGNEPTSSIEEPVIPKHRKFFRRRSKSHESISLNGKDKIVILKPDNQSQMENNASQFSFMEIKRRLKHVMGKEDRARGPHDKTVKTSVDTGWSSPNRDHFYTERFARVSKLRESEMKTSETNHQISNIYVEAKNHLSEMLTSGDKDAETMMRSLPKSLGRLLSIREYNSLSPGTSPREQTKPPVLEASQMVNESQPSGTNDDLEEKVVVSDDMSSQGVQEIIKSPSCDKEHEEQTEVLDLSCEPSSSSNRVNEAILDDELLSESLKQNLSEELELSSSRTISPVGPSTISKTEELETTTRDRTEKPSPVSVLEPLFSDDDISPARTVSRSVDATVQPLSIRFDEPVSVSEDQQIVQIRNSTDSEESAFEYVEAVLLSSDLKWHEFETRWLASVPILDPSLFTEVEIFSSRTRHDQRLLFDSTNEALQDVCDRFVLESSFIKRAVWPVPKGMDLINDVWGRIDSRLCKAYPRDMGQLVKYELERSRTWMDFRSEARDLVTRIEESIFEETINDTLLSLLSGHVDTDGEGLDRSLCVFGVLGDCVH